MGILTDGSKCFPVGWSAAASVAKPCDCCRSAAALVFCRTDNMFMCMGCDARVHENARHERVWVCEVCDQAPASVTCKADAAALCVTCDRDIHSANPLAQRHERIPVVPFYNTAESVLKSTAATLFVSNNNDSNVPTATTTTTTATTTGCGGAGIFDSKLNACIGHNEQDYITDPWISSNTAITNTSPTSKIPAHAPPPLKSIDFLFSESENFLDFEYSVSLPNNSHQSHYNSANDSVVPDHTTITPPLNHQKMQFEIDFTRSHISSYSTPSLSQSMSSSSLDVGVVPEGSSMSEISFPYRRSVNSSGVDMGNSRTAANGCSQFLGMDREARVLRYREKRKNRKFEKTIRYASRKAYAETRPRIKGRFAKRTNVEDADDDFHAPEPRYGVVPSF